MMERFSFKTKEGCSRLLALFIILILLSSFLGQLSQTDGGAIKIESIVLDAQGAELNGELYYPAGTTSNDKLPAVIVNHGGGCIYGTMKNIAQEIARRGFVVFNVSAYGSGLSAQPDYDDAGQGINGFFQSLKAVEGQESFLPSATPMGLHDAVNFVRSLAFVDTENIGMVGHSMGAYRTSAAVALDCGFLSLNDTMINVLYDEFEQRFAEEEINEDADSLAEARLNPDQLAYYYDLRAEKEEYFNTRVRSAIILGIGYEAVTTHPQTVQVAGYDVQRNVQANICYMSGDYDATYCFGSLDAAKSDWYSDSDMVMGDWYELDDVHAAISDIGSIFSGTVTENNELASAINRKTSRIFIITEKETHSKEFFSSRTNTAIVKYFEQTLGFNGGYLSSGTNTPVDASSNTWWLRVICNTVAMFSMIGMLAALAGRLVKADFFKTSITEIDESKRPVYTKKALAVQAAITIALSFAAIYYSNAKGLFIFNPSKMWPLGRSCSLAMTFIICLGIAAAIMLAVYLLMATKEQRQGSLSVLNIGIRFKNIIKHITLAIILVIAAYASLAMIQYFFGQEYRLWMTAFSEMKADYWYIALRYVLLLFPLYMLISMGINYGARNDIPEWKDTLICVLVNSAGIWLCCLINILVAFSKPYQGLFFSSFICSYQMLTVVPITTYLNRKMYKLTKSIWAGAALCAILVAWTLVCTLGINDVFYGQTALGNFLFK